MHPSKEREQSGKDFNRSLFKMFKEIQAGSRIHKTRTGIHEVGKKKREANRESIREIYSHADI